MFLYGFSTSGHNLQNRGVILSHKDTMLCVLARFLKQWSKAKLLNKPLSVLTHSALHKAKSTFCSLSLLKTDGLFLPIQSLCCASTASWPICQGIHVMIFLSRSPPQKTLLPLSSLFFCPFLITAPPPIQQTRTQLVSMATTPSTVHAFPVRGLILNLSITFCLALR